MSRARSALMLAGLAARRSASSSASSSPARPAAAVLARSLCSSASGASASDAVLLTDIDEERGIATLTINRPKALNALNTEVVMGLRDQYALLGADDRVRCLVLTGSERAFAAGADIKEMLTMDYHEMESHDRSKSLLHMAALSCVKPIVGAVNGFAFGGGCEVAMSCDIIIAGENAKFGQPEIK